MDALPPFGSSSGETQADPSQDKVRGTADNNRAVSQVQHRQVYRGTMARYDESSTHVDRWPYTKLSIGSTLSTFESNAPEGNETNDVIRPETRPSYSIIMHFLSCRHLDVSKVSDVLLVHQVSTFLSFCHWNAPLIQSLLTGCKDDQNP